MGAYLDVRQKIMNKGEITQADAKAFFEDLFKISQTRILQEVGSEYSKYFPTRLYRGPGGLLDRPNGWKFGEPLGVCDHFTASDSHRSALRWFSSYDKWNKGPGKIGHSGASAALVIALSGEPFLLIDFWNGKSDWHEPALNGVALGIEHVNCGELRERDGKFFWWPSNWQAPYPHTDSLPPQPVDYRGAKWMQPYTREQLLTNAVIKRAFVALYSKNVRAELFVDHAMYRDDKKDQGPLWPLAEIRKIAFSKAPLSSFEIFKDYTPAVGATVDAVDSMDLAVIQGTIINSEMPVNLNSDEDPQLALGVQLGLQQLGYSVNTDGKFNDVFLNAVKKFQKDNNLTADGVAGPKTRSQITSLLQLKNKPKS